MSYIGSTPTTQSFIEGTDYFNGDGSTVAFTLSRTVNSVNDIQATINNVVQQPNTAYTISGNTITFTSAPSSGSSNIYVRYLSTTTQTLVPSQGTVGISSFSATGTPSSSTFLRGDNTWASAGFVSGTLMLFQQTAAPTGWTKQTTHDNKALRVVSGTASSGGSVAFTTAFASGLSADATTLSTAQMPAHTHTAAGANRVGGYAAGNDAIDRVTQTTSSTGGGGSHTHTLPSFAVSYVDLIIASKD